MLRVFCWCSNLLLGLSLQINSSVISIFFTFISGTATQLSNLVEVAKNISDSYSRVDHTNIYAGIQIDPTYLLWHLGCVCGRGEERKNFRRGEEEFLCW